MIHTYIYIIYLYRPIFLRIHMSHVHMHACIHISTHIYLYIYIYVHACISLHFRKLLLKQHDHHDHVAAIGDELVFHDLEGLESQC